MACPLGHWFALDGPERCIPFPGEDTSNEVFLEAQKYLDEVTKDNKKLLIVSNDSKRKEIQTKAKQLDIDLFVRCENLKEELMMNKAWFYTESKTVVDDLQKELIQFDK